MGRKSKGARAAARMLRGMSAEPARSPSRQRDFTNSTQQWLQAQSILYQIQWLSSANGAAAFGRRTADDMAETRQKRWDEATRTVPSDPWLMSVNENQPFPVQGMVQSRGRIRIGAGAVPTRRFIPPIAQMEDDLDVMDCVAIAYHTNDWDPSCSAVAIEKIRHRKLLPKRTKLKRKREPKAWRGNP
jgi:hypothetical protein